MKARALFSLLCFLYAISLVDCWRPAGCLLRISSRGTRSALHGPGTSSSTSLSLSPSSPSSVLLLAKAWWDDDLPNILGINPIEAAIIFGVLYYFYGPNTLYEYARNAGKLFGTYAPVVKQASVDIFYEFRDFLEEDREREALRRAGVDLSGLPRRTTNVIERVQQAFQAFSELSDGANRESTIDASTMAGEAVVEEEEEDRGSNSNSNRSGNSSGDSSMRRNRSKKEMLAKRQVSSLSPPPPAAATAATSSARLEEEGTELSPPPPPAPAAAVAINAMSQGGGLEGMMGMSRFQQQLSGEWNQRVMRRERFAGADDTLQQQIEEVVEEEKEQEEEGWGLPQELSAHDVPPPPAATPPLASEEVEEVLREIDRDYLALRSRLVRLLQSTPPPPPPPPPPAAGSVMETLPVPSLAMQVEKELTLPVAPHSEQEEQDAGSSRRYWPPLSHSPRTTSSLC